MQRTKSERTFGHGAPPITGRILWRPATEFEFVSIVQPDRKVLPKFFGQKSGTGDIWDEKYPNVREFRFCLSLGYFSSVPNS